MENFIVSARKYRPVMFSEVIGQDTVTQTLKNAVLSNHLAHSYLFCGPRGVGKTTVARILAKTINCEHITPEGEPCNKCESCTAFNENRSFNIHELDAASNNSVEDIRNLIEQVRVPPQIGKYSVYIIDEVHMLSAAAFNTFLKTLEEPPRYAIFIMATTEKQKILPTILSRCQVFDFNRIRVEDIARHLQYVADKENITVEPEALNVIARKADGALRDALSIFDQLVSYSGKYLTYQSVIKSLNVLDYEYFFIITRKLLEGNYKDSLLTFDEILKKGFDAQHFLSGLSSHFRDLLVAKDKETLPLLEVGDVIREHYLQQAQLCPTDFLYQALDICYQADITYRSSKNQRLHIELALLKISLFKKNSETTSPAEHIPEREKKHQTKKKTNPDTGKPSPTAKSNILQKEKQPEQTTEKNTGIINEEVKVKKTEKERKEEIKSASDISGETSSATISIKDALNGNLKSRNQDDEKKEQAGIVHESKTEKPFTLEQLQEKWLTFADNIYTDKPRFSAALRSHLPVLVEHRTIKITLENKNLKEDFEQNIKPALLDYLKKELNHYGIHILVDVDQNTSTGKKPYTAEEKFAYLTSKNPELQQLKNEFDLDFE